MACGESTGELDPATVSSEACATAPIIESQPSSLPTHVADNEDENMRLNSPPPKKEKDPRKVARKYQLELCKKAMEENVIVYLGTGCGKTHIAVLLIYELGHLIRKPGKNVCVFLAPTVPLVQQQARVIEESVDFKVGTYYGGSRHLKTHGDWEKQLEQYEVLVMTPEILLRNLHHCFIKMELIALLIFDECHHAQVKSNHPYAQIMKVFYETDASKLPRIFGMTASPVVGKGASDQANLPKSINSLENLLNAKVYSVEDKEELESFVASPVFRVYDYGPVVNEKCSPSMIYCTKLEEIKQQCMSTLKRQTDDQQYFRSMKKQLTRMHENLLFCLGSLGLWGALQASRIASTVDHCERKELMEEDGNFSDDSLCDTYLTQAAEVFASDFTGDGVASDLSSIDVLKEPFFSRKLLRLIGILSSFRLQPNMKCIIFVNRIITAISLSYILQNLKFLASWKCHFLIGVHAGLKSMSRKTMNVILEKFQSGELNLLVATKVGEEGLDIQTCCLVVRFDLPETVASFIQSRGRARMPQSEYAFLVDSGNEKEINLIENFKRDEDRMNVEIVSRTSDGIFARFDERIYKVDSTGASISPGYSISLLHHYCSRLPHDEYFDPKPKFYFFDDLDGTVCHIVLPSNAPIRRSVSTPQASIEAAKKDACLTAIEQLHKLGVLNDYLLPEENDADKEETILNSFDPDSSEEEELRGELYEMIVPAVLKGPWSMSDGHVNLSCYYIKFIPDPDDRIYRKFGLFLKAPLPVEAEEMELDLHLARRRSVMTRLIRAGFTEFSKDEITQAQNFQQMFFKVILDRSELIAEFVPSERNFFSESSSPTFYLLLPVILSECESTVHVDWQIVRRCLSSPMFKTPADPMEQEVHPSGLHLQLANGCWSITDVENSLVYAPHKKQFFFTTHVVHDRNAYGPFKESSTSSHMEHLFKTFSIRLKYPEQPLLQAKPLFGLRNLLHNRKPEDTESQELEEFFIYVPPELFQLKIIGFSKDIGSSLSLLPSIMHRLENLLVAIELKHLLSASFPEGAEVTALRVLEALTTEKCQERFSLERLELLGDAFLKFAVGRHLFLLHDTLDEGELTRKRSNAVNNSNLFKLATRSNIQVYIRDQSFEPCHFFAWGRPCPVICNEETEGAIHSPCRHSAAAKPNPSAVRCSKGHLWLCKKTIADVVEALVGAFIVDSGFKAATAFLRWIGIRVDFEASQVIKACSASKIYMPLAASMDVTALESLLGYQFHHKGLLLQAFVHPSYSKHGGGCYQRLEFLGDAVLDYLITSYLFSVYPKLKPGQLTDLRSVSVNNKAFADVAVNQSFHKFLFCDSSSLSIAIEKYAEFVSGPASESNHFEGPKCPKVLGDLVESCLGAILLDSGFNLNCVWKIMLSFLDPIRSFSSLQLNPVRELQELCQSHDWDLQFSASKKGGIFFVEAKVTMTDDSVAFSASSASKKDATKIASQLTFAKLKGQGYVPKTKSLKEVLMSSVKMEAKLIGYDETPTDVMASIAPEFENLKLEGPFGRDINPNGGLISEPTITRPSCIIPIGKLPSSSSGVGRGPSSETTADPSSETHIQTTGGLHKGSAKSRLSEVCVANCWKAPVYECCEEEGPSHLKLFTYKVILEIDEAPDTTVECFGEPKTKKKVAAEHAAEGALWYLEHQGYLH